MTLTICRLLLTIDLTDLSTEFRLFPLFYQSSEFIGGIVIYFAWSRSSWFFCLETNMDRIGWPKIRNGKILEQWAQWERKYAMEIHYMFINE